jgi:hypothetical protein
MTYEKSDVHHFGLIAFVAGTAILLLVALAITVPLLKQADSLETRHHAPDHPLADAKAMPPEPRLQVTPSQDLMVHSAKIATELSSYGWVDKNAGRIKIPIERAMELTVEELK